MTFFFSNDLPTLKKLFVSNVFNQEPFLKRIVVTPHVAIAQQLKLALAQEKGISMGIEWLTFDQWLRLIQDPLAPLLSVQQLLFALFKILDSIDSNIPEYDRIEAYLHDDEKKISLALHLARLFYEYQIYGEKSVSHFFQKPAKWHEYCFTQIYQQTKPFCSADTLTLPTCHTHLHLFGFSNLPKLLLGYLEHIHQNAYCYYLTPCQEFWSDYYYQEAIDLAESSPLLIDLGHQGSYFHQLIEQSCLETKEHFVIPHIQHNLSLLQHDLLYSNPSQTAALKDDSIQIHFLPHRIAEVELVYLKVREQLQQGVPPEKIVILAPNILDYASIIEGTFKDIPYAIHDLPIFEQDPGFKGIELLYTLEEKRWSISAIFELLNHPYLTKLPITQELSKLQQLCYKSGITWGWDLAHRQTLLSYTDKKTVSSEGTWIWGLKKLLLCSVQDPSCRIDSSDYAVIEEFFLFLKQLFEDVRAFYTQSYEFSQWIHWTQQLYDRYFEPSPWLWNQLNSIACSYTKAISFEIWWKIVLECIQHYKKTLNAHRINAICCASLIPDRLWECDVLILLGMDQDSFPRRDQHLFNLAFPINSKKQKDEFVLLQGFLTPKKNLLITYSGAKEQTSSSFALDSLLPYAKMIEHPTTEPFVLKAPLVQQIQKIIPTTKPSLLSHHLLSIEQLCRAFTAPIKHYIRQRDIYIHKETILPKDDPYQLNAWQKKNIVEDDIPLLGLFKQIEQRSSHKELLKYQACQQALGSLEYVSLDVSTTTVYRSKQERIYPALRINIEQDSLCIIGQLGLFGSKGMVVSGKPTLRQKLKELFYLTLAHLVAQNYPLSLEHCFSLHTERMIERTISNPIELLHSMHTGYQKLSSTFIPIVPEWIEPLLQQDAVTLQKKIDEYLARDYDTEIKLMAQRQGFLATELIQSYYEDVNHIYSPFITAIGSF